MSFTKGTAALYLGCRHTKLALGFRKGNGDQQLSSVPFDGVRNDPDYPDSNDEFEFIAYAGLTPDRQWVEGRAALSCNTQVPIKTLLVWVSGIRRTAIIDRIPGGQLTRELFHDELITIDTARAILLRHLRRMTTMMLMHANRQQVDVVRIVLLYPSYLWPAEGEDDFDRYKDCYRGLMRACLSHRIEFYPINEGLASILYMSEPFVDSISGSTKALLPNLFSDMYTAKWAYLLFVDWGSSTMVNFVVSIASVVSGSDIANDDVRSLIQRDLTQMSQAGLADFREGTLVFERQKRQIDYSEYTIRNRTLYLHDDEDNGADIQIDLPAKELARIFEHAYNPGLRLLQRVIHRVLTSSIAFTVIFSGGSVMNHGLRKKLESVMERYKRHAVNKGVELRTVFMSDLQTRWFTTNACGAAGAFDRAPSFASIVHDISIGVQRVDIDLNMVGKIPPSE
ncbi:hypothetical protein PG999_012999 [Apiospora kogelbergensis]|uniref:Actin-like ATPase domain-containing protein n=1 Tax=Apiospora kogelbergensis TaxID=1337665 RepID=A0AAW0Q8I5_9PEZI